LSLRVVGVVLQTLGVEAIVLGFVSYMAKLWVRYGWRADEEAPPTIYGSGFMRFLPARVLGLRSFQHLHGDAYAAYFGVAVLFGDTEVVAQ
jgi:hypothetical protein